MTDRLQVTGDDGLVYSVSLGKLGYRVSTGDKWWFASSVEAALLSEVAKLRARAVEQEREIAALKSALDKSLAGQNLQATQIYNLQRELDDTGSRATLARVTAERDRLDYLIRWTLGEVGDFQLPAKDSPRYYLRRELRTKYEAAVVEPPQAPEET